MEKDIILDGIIKYTREKKIKWIIFYDRQLIPQYKCNYIIHNKKYISLDFIYDYKNPNNSIIDIYIMNDNIDLFSQGYGKKFVTIDVCGRINRFKELISLIEPRFPKRIIH